MRPLLAAAALTLTLTAGDAGAADAKPRTEITWWGHAAFTVKTPGGTVLAIDPFFANGKSQVSGVSDGQAEPGNHQRQ